MNKKERLELANWAVGRAQAHGADQTSVDITNSRRIEIQYRDQKLEKLKESAQNTLSLTIYAKNRYSGHSTCDLKKSSLEPFIKEAVIGTKYLTEDKYRALPDPKYYPKKIKGDLKKVDPAYKNIESAKRKAIAAEIESIASQVSDKIISTTASYSDTYGEAVKIHSNGFEGESAGTSFSCSASVSVMDKNGKPSDYAYGATRFFKDLPDPEAIAKEAAKRALRKIGQKKIASGKYSMLVENRVSGRVLSILQGPMSGRALQQKASCLEGKLGKQIASKILTMQDDPFVEKGLASRFYDGEGMAAKKRLIIEDGVLRTFYISNYYAKKMGVEPTSSSPANVIFKTSDISKEDLIKGIKKGILITSFIGGNSNPATGDFSFGIVGLLVEDGQIVHPVNEMNISGNALDFMMRLSAVGNDPFPYASLRSPTLLFDDVQFSGL
jgi:PmbA protein